MDELTSGTEEGEEKKIPEDYLYINFYKKKVSN